MNKKLMLPLCGWVAGLVVMLLGSSIGYSEDWWTEASDPKNFSATVTFATDYVLRGVSQTDNKPAVQGSFNYKHPLGLYAGIWGSNVADYVSNGNIELDFYGGYGVELLPNFNLDASIIYYYYPGSGHDPNRSYVEGHLGLDYTFKDLPLSPKITGGYNYSPDYYGEDGDGHYVSGRLDLSLPYDFTIYGLVGYQWVEGDKTTGNGNGENGGNGFDYTHWQFGISRPVLGFVLELSYHNTDNANFLGHDIADQRVVFGISRTF